MDETVTRSLLVGLAGDELEDVLSAFTPRHFEAGETIVRMGDDGDELFLIVNGKARVWTGAGPALSERTLSVLGPGEHFGEASMLSRSKRTATVTALTFVETLVLRGDDYRRLLTRHPQLLENISRSLESSSVGDERRIHDDGKAAAARCSFAGRGGGGRRRLVARRRPVGKNASWKPSRTTSRVVRR